MTNRPFLNPMIGFAKGHFVLQAFQTTVFLTLPAKGEKQI